MHDYMVANKIRRKVNELLICGYLVVVFLTRLFILDNVEAKFALPISPDGLLLLEMILSIVLQAVYEWLNHIRIMGNQQVF